MKVLVTGVGGQLGFDVVRVLNEQHINNLPCDRSAFSLTDFEAARKAVSDYKPDAVIHTAAYTAVDKAESEKELAYKTNFEATKNLAEAAKDIDAKFLYISTDYVFAGTGENYYKTSDATNPVNIYGKSKLMGEDAVLKTLDKYFIMRISWVFGKNGNNFVKTMLKLAENRDEIKVVADQIGSPTYTYDLAKLLVKMVQTEKYGIYHATNEGICSWAEFAEEIFKLSDKNTKVTKIPTEEYPTPAPRPKNSRLSKKSLDENGFKRLPPWQDALKRFLTEIHDV